jgi:NTE family protein
MAARLPVHTWPERPLAVVAVDASTGETRVFDGRSGAGLVDAVAASSAVPGIWPPVTIDGRRYVDGAVRSNENAYLALGYDRVLVLSPKPAEALSPPWGGLVDAVAASSAVPGIWPPVTIDGRRYVDGAVRSNENAYLALGYDRVLVLSPKPAEALSPPWGGLDDEVTELRRRGAEVMVVHPDEQSVAAMGYNPLDPAVRAPTARAGRDQGRREASRVARTWDAG